MKSKLRQKVNRRKLTIEMDEKEKHLVGILTLTGVSNWLTVLPITEFGLELSKQPFWDSIRLRHGWENMQSTNIVFLQ